MQFKLNVECLYQQINFRKGVCQTVMGLLPLAFTASLEEQRKNLAGQAKYFLTKALAGVVPWCPSLPSFLPLALLCNEVLSEVG